MKHKQRGFTLIELMIAVAIVGILAAIAYPSYQEQVRKGKRTDATAALLVAAQQLERCYTTNNGYDAASGCGVTFPQNSPESEYQITAARAATTFTLTATPTGSQTSDPNCLNFTLTNVGVKGGTGGKWGSLAAGRDYCW